MMKIKTIQKEFCLEEIWASYLSSYIIIFLIKNNLFDNEIEHIFIKKELLKELHTSILKSLTDLLDVFYSEPTNRQLNKHSSSFEKIYVENRIFKVNYRMSDIGRMAYFIYCLLEFIKEAELQEREILLYLHSKK